MLGVVNVSTVKLKKLNRKGAGLHFIDQEDVSIEELRAGGIRPKWKEFHVCLVLSDSWTRRTPCIMGWKEQW